MLCKHVQQPISIPNLAIHFSVRTASSRCGRNSPSSLPYCARGAPAPRRRSSLRPTACLRRWHPYQLQSLHATDAPPSSAVPPQALARAVGQRGHRFLKQIILTQHSRIQPFLATPTCTTLRGNSMRNAATSLATIDTPSPPLTPPRHHLTPLATIDIPSPPSTSPPHQEPGHHRLPRASCPRARSSGARHWSARAGAQRTTRLCRCSCGFSK